MTTNRKPNPRKELLIKMSATVKSLMDMGELEDCANVNEGLIELFFKGKEKPELSTFNGWKKKGFKVIKGEKSEVFVWSKPRKGIKKNEVKTEAKDDKEKKYKFWGLAYLFTQSQVEPI